MSGIKYGDVDIGDQVLDNEYRIKLIFGIVQRILEKNPTLKGVTQTDLDEIKKKIEKDLQVKYPNLGLKLK